MAESNTSDRLKRTPLFEQHEKLGGKLVGFAGWELPVRYSGLIEEHNAVRNAAGLFDVSHMGEIVVSGPEAEASLQSLTCNDVTKLVDGKAQYTAITNERGGVVDDIIIYRFSATSYLLCVNASNCESDFKWLQEKNNFDAEYKNVSSDWAQIAIQGPRAEAILIKLDGAQSLGDLGFFNFVETELLGAPVIVARTGYTGEDGFEIFTKSEAVGSVWEALLEAGEPEGIKPCGLGARDTLRLEACLPLHGHELSPDITALESGLSFFIKLKSGPFTGSDVLAAQKENGVPRSLVGFVVEGKGIAREETAVFSEAGEEIGLVTSGTRSPTLDAALGLALVKSDFKAVDTPLVLNVRGRELRAKVVKKPFYKRA